jgi:hypothetical protein
VIIDTRGKGGGVAGIAKPVAVSIIESQVEYEYSRPLVGRVDIMILQESTSAEIMSIDSRIRTSGSMAAPGPGSAIIVKRRDE